MQKRHLRALQGPEMVEEVDKYIHLNLIRFVLALISHSDVIHALAKSAKEYITTPSYVYKHLKSQKVYTANLTRSSKLKREWFKL